jgi:hypothetical protein
MSFGSGKRTLVGSLTWPYRFGAWQELPSRSRLN